MLPSSRTPEGQPNCCPVCGGQLRLEPSIPPGDAPCPHCGHLLWFVGGTVRPQLMNLHEQIGDVVVPDLVQASKGVLLETLVTRLADARHLPQAEVASVVQSLLHRENLGSTGIGDGVAVPHVEHSSVTRKTTAVGYAPKGLDFGSLDSEKVYVIVLVILPEGQPEARTKMSEEISLALRRVLS